MSSSLSAAFVLGAGLGTRLLPLTEKRPKPLVPVFQKPLITFALDHLSSLGIQTVAINTHHAPEMYGKLLGADSGAAKYQNLSLVFRHEPVLLETGGGLKNVEEVFRDQTVLIHNGDILTDLPIARGWAEHQEQQNDVTLILRSSGGPLQVQYNACSGRVEDIRNIRGGSQAPAFLFTGIYFVEPCVFSYLSKNAVESIVPAFLRMIEDGRRIGGIVLDDGKWLDLGNRRQYLEAHRLLHEGYRLGFLPPETHFPQPVHPSAKIHPSARLLGYYAIGANATVEEGAILENSIVWENSRVCSGSSLKNCIVRDNQIAPMGNHEDKDF